MKDIQPKAPTATVRRKGSVPSPAAVSTARFSSRRWPAACSALLAVFLCALSSAAASPAAADTEFGQEGTLSLGNITGGSGVVTGAGGIAIDPESGVIYVANGFNSWVSKFDGQTNPLFAWGWGVADKSQEMQTCTATCLQGPFVYTAATTDAMLGSEALAVDPSPPHQVYVEDSPNRRFEAFTKEGEFLFAFGGDVVAYGPDNSANDEIQSLAVSATGGTFKLEFRYPWNAAAFETPPHPETAPLPFNATAAEIQGALNSLSTVDGADVSGGSIAVAEAGAGEFELTFEGNLGGDNVPQIQTNSGSLTGGQAAVTTIHPGGATEVCKLSAGDTCKAGDLGSANGEFAGWPSAAPRIAVGESGTVYVGDANRVQKFDSTGAYLGEVAIPGGGETQALALDSSEDLFVVTESLGVREYDSAGSLLRTLAPEPEGVTSTPKTVSVDADGDVYVGEKIADSGEARFEFSAYKPDGTYSAQFTSPLIHTCPPGNGGSAVGGTAIKGGSLYATNFTTTCEEVHHAVILALPEPGPPQVSDQHVTSIEPTTATLHALVNPEQFDTEYHFEYTTTDFANCGLPANPACHTVAPLEPDLGSISREDPVQAAISGLTPSTAYHWRVVATNSEGTAEPEQTFETLPNVGLRDFTTQTVGPELVKLKAELNPNNGGTTEYTIRYGTDAPAYDCEGANTCTAHGTLHGVGSEFEPITATFAGLQPDTTYHYQLLASNSNGPIETTDQTFTTEATLAEENAAVACPNQTLREENSSLALPDCRAYEQVSAADKRGGQVYGAEVPLAPSGDAAFYASNGDFAGSTFDGLALIPYMAFRSPAGGWRTQPLISTLQRAGEQPSLLGFIASDEFDRWLIGESTGLDAVSANEASLGGHLAIGSADGSIFPNASPTVTVEGPPRPTVTIFNVEAYSRDLSTLLIATSSRLTAADPRPQGPDSLHGFSQDSSTRLYRVTGTVSGAPQIELVDELPLGLTPGQREFSACAVDFTQMHVANRSERTISGDGAAVAYTRPIEEQAGAPCGEGQPNPIGLFLKYGREAPFQLNTPPSAQCQAPFPCSTAPPRSPLLDGISPDGSRVWFTTQQPLVDADANSSNDLYMAELSEGHLDRLVLASAAAADAPQPGLAGKVGEDGLQLSEPSFWPKQGVLSISLDGSHVAFESANVLTSAGNSAGDTPTSGANNLYVYDGNTASLRFVAELCSGPGLSGTEPGGDPHGHHVTPATSVADQACPPGLDASFIPPGVGEKNDTTLWMKSFQRGPVSFTPDGKYLLFSSWGRLTSDDTDEVPDLFRFEFSTGELIRVSIGKHGNDANGNDDATTTAILSEGAVFSGEGHFGSLAENGYRPISASGTRIVFGTDAPLVSRDTNHAEDVYEWEQSGQGTCREAGGCVNLVSDGTAPHGARGGVISASGRDIAFLTAAGLAPADADGVNDVYDARENGGFPYVPPRQMPCQEGSPEACHGESTHPSPPSSFTTEQFVGPGNEPTQLHCGKGRRRVTKHGRVRCVPDKPHKKHHGKHKRAAHNKGRRK